MNSFVHWGSSIILAVVLTGKRRPRMTIAIIVFGAAIVAAVIYARVTASVDGVLLVRALPVAPRSDGTTANTLVVLVHGYQGNEDTMAGVAAVVREKRRDADLLFVRFPARTFSNAEPRAISAELCDKIEEQFAGSGRAYKDVVLIGHSSGALLVRKAFLYGLGQSDVPGDSPSLTSAVTWARHVDRIVLLAGMNRGWSLDPPPAEMRWHKRWLIAGVKWFADKTGTGKLIRSMERGEPFIADLRVQWLRAFEWSRREPGRSFPPVIQFLGSRDDVVTDDDSQDVSVTSDFIRVRLHGTGHGDIIDLEGDGYAAVRRQRIAMAFDPNLEAVRRIRQQSVPDRRDASVTDVVFIMHGIRDWGGEWTGPLETALVEGFRSKPPPDLPDGRKRKIRVVRSGYGYFPMLPFLIWEDRQKNVRWFMDEYTETLAKYPNADGRVSYIGHSNGTYILSSALRKYSSLNVDKVVFAGSVVRTDYDWDEVRGRVGGLKNYVADADWVVGIFPKLFELFDVRDLGSAGFNGFRQDYGKRHQVEFVRGSHGAAIQEENFASIVDFTVHGTNTLSPTLKSDRPRAWLSVISNNCWFAWALLLAGIFAAGYFVVPFIGMKMHLRLVVAEAVYVLILIALLHTF